MNVYQCLNMGILNTVERFLSQASLRPAILNPSVTIPQLIGCKGIVHYTRSGTRTEVASPTYGLTEGDFLVVAAQCASGQTHIIPTTFVPTDYAFIMGSGDDFYTAARRYMESRPATKVITTCTSLEAVLKTLISGDQITTPIRNVLIVSHARGEGILDFRLTATDADDKIYLDELCLYANDTTVRPQITTRVINNNAATNIHICGCNIGAEIRFLRLIKQIFGSNVTVTAPKHFDYFGEFSNRGNTNVRFEYMQQNMTIRQKTRPKNRSALIQLFVAGNYMDIHGNPITQQNFESWIPSSIHTASRETEYSCNNPIHASAGRFIKRQYKYRNETIFVFNISYPADVNPPVSTADRLVELRNSISRCPEMQNDWPSQQCQFPQYVRWGYKSVDDMVDSLAWTFEWRRQSRKLVCTGKRHEYQLRIPITDANNNIMINVLPASGIPQYIRNDIVETDTRFFGRV